MTRRIDHEAAANALRSAATEFGIEPASLTVEQYRQARGRDHAMPSELAISLAFGGWHRAVDHAGQLRARETAVAGTPGRHVPPPPAPAHGQPHVRGNR